MKEKGKLIGLGIVGLAVLAIGFTIVPFPVSVMITLVGGGMIGFGFGRAFYKDG